jgi:DNA-directed RNA polymerase specialized sigma24 family protein
MLLVMRRQPTAETQPDSPELTRLRIQCSHVASGLFSDPEAADEAVEQMFQEIPAPLRQPSNRRVLEKWLLAEIVLRGRRHEREVAEREARRKRADASLDMLWRKLHWRGDLAPLLQQLPAAHAEAFTLHYIERAPLNEMMRRTGASAGVITHRIAQASERLRRLTASGNPEDLTGV